MPIQPGYGGAEDWSATDTGDWAAPAAPTPAAAAAAPAAVAPAAVAPAAVAPAAPTNEWGGGAAENWG